MIIVAQRLEYRDSSHRQIATTGFRPIQHGDLPIQAIGAWRFEFRHVLIGREHTGVVATILWALGHRQIGRKGAMSILEPCEPPLNLLRLDI